MQNEIVEEFSFFEDWTDKYAHIIEYAKSLPSYPEAVRDEDHLVKGCTSRVWLHAEDQGGKIQFYADSDAIITKGLIALLLGLYTGRSPQAILDNPPRFIEEIGLSGQLSPNRANGLNSMVKQIKNYALAIRAIQQK